MIVFRVDGNSEIGMGHMMRCIPIALKVKKAGKKLCFLITEDSDTEKLQDEQLPFVKIKPSENSICASEDVMTWLKSNQPNVILLDSYRVKPEDLNKLRRFGYLVYLDDLYAFQYDADAIINYNLEATTERYGEDCKVQLYLGPQYFPARTEIATASKHQNREHIHNILISNGSTDASGITDAILSAIQPQMHTDIQFNCLLGKFFSDQYCKALKKKYADGINIHWIPWGPNMGELYARTDLMIAPAATMIYEAFTVGVPCISYMFSDNQKDQGFIMDYNNMAPCAGDFRCAIGKVQRNLMNLFVKMKSKTIRDQYQSRFFELFDGRGANRIAEILLKEDAK